MLRTSAPDDHNDDDDDDDNGEGRRWRGRRDKWTTEQMKIKVMS